MEVLRLSAILLLLTSNLLAMEVAELRNGFAVRHRSREVREGVVRLFLDEQRSNFIDLPAGDVERYSNEPDPLPDVKAPEVKSTHQIVREASDAHGVDSDFINSVIKQESGGNTQAVSRTGAKGLMQLMPGTASQLGVSDSFSPEQNVHGGARYLRELLERYNGDAVRALAAYNAGPGAVDRYKGVPPYKETRQYVKRVVHEYNKTKQSLPKSKTVSTKHRSVAIAQQNAKQAN